MMTLRSPPTAMPGIPMSQPLITSPLPSLKEKGFPFLLATRLLAISRLRKSPERHTIKYLPIFELANISHRHLISLLSHTTLAKLFIIYFDSLNLFDPQSASHLIVLFLRWRRGRALFKILRKLNFLV